MADQTREQTPPLCGTKRGRDDDTTHPAKRAKKLTAEGEVLMDFLRESILGQHGPAGLLLGDVTFQHLRAAKNLRDICVSTHTQDSGQPSDPAVHDAHAPRVAHASPPDPADEPAGTYGRTGSIATVNYHGGVSW